MYVLDEFMAKLEEVRREYGGQTPVLVPTCSKQTAYENAAVNLVKALAHVDVEGGEIFKPDETGVVVAVII